VNEIITNKSIQEYPIKLKQRVVDSLVKDNIFIIILIFKKQPSDELINKINEIKNEIKTKYKQEIYITGIPAISNELKKSQFYYNPNCYTNSINYRFYPSFIILQICNYRFTFFINILNHDNNNLLSSILNCRSNNKP